MATITQVRRVKAELEKLDPQGETFIVLATGWPTLDQFLLGVEILVPTSFAADTGDIQRQARKVAQDHQVRLNFTELPPCFKKSTRVSDQMIKLEVGGDASVEGVINTLVALLQRFDLSDCHLVWSQLSFQGLPSRAYLEDDEKRGKYIAYIASLPTQG